MSNTSISKSCLSEPRILAAFPEDLSAFPRRSVEKIGVDVRMKSAVADIPAHGAYINGEFVRAE